MRVTIFCHSLLSDWNHGNAHFLRGVCSELIARGQQVDVYEPADAWSLANLVNEHGEVPLQGFARAYPIPLQAEEPVLFHCQFIQQCEAAPCFLPIR